MVIIVDLALKPFRVTPGHSFKIDGPPVWLNAQIALALMLALHELATNADKYAPCPTTAAA